MKKITLLLLICTSTFSFSQWSNFSYINTPVCTAAKYQHEVRVVSDGKGGAIAAWLDHRNDATFPTPDSSNTDIYVQRLDKDGFAKWTINGAAICINSADQPSVNIVTDGAGGAIIVWKDERADLNGDVYAQRIDSSGNVKWATDGVPVCNGAAKQKGAKAVSDGAGGVIVAFEYKVIVAGSDWQIYAQRLDANGNPLWTTGGKPVSFPTNGLDHYNARVETDGNGGAIIVWTMQDNGSMLDYDILAQRIDAAGNPVWATGGVCVACDATYQVNPKIEPDGNGGAIIVWMDSTSFGLADIYAQRLDGATGSRLWAGGNKLAVCTQAAYQGAPDAATEGINGVVIAWKDARNGNKDVYAQMVDMNGTAKWAFNGIPVASTSVDEANPNLYGDGFGNVICTYQDSMVGGSQTIGNVTAQKIDQNGNLLWGAGAVVANAANLQTQPKHVPDGNGGAIFFFMDNRADSLNYDIYAHHLYWPGER